MAKAKGIANPLPPLSRLREVFFFPSPEGKLYWLKPSSKKFHALDEAGWLNESGYLNVAIDGKNYRAHRIVYSMRHGIELSPSAQIDHKDGNPRNNHIDNLREATNAENSRNSRINKNNTSGYKGVCWHKWEFKWYARIMYQGKYIFLGYYATPEQAALAYNEAAKRLHGEFARLNVIPETPRLGRPLGEQLTLFDPPIENALGEKGVSNAY